MKLVVVMLLGICLAGVVSSESFAAEKQKTVRPDTTLVDDTQLKVAQEIPPRPHVPGEFLVKLQSRVKQSESKEVQSVVKETKWKASETAIIICDMWDNHYCQSAAQRVDAMADRMNEVVSAARAHGALIIHAPSGCMEYYADTLYRQRARLATFSQAPIELQGWCYLDPKSEAEMPVDASKSPCDDPIVGEAVRVFDHQHDKIKMIGYDAISDNGQEVYNLLRQDGIKNVVMMGVHTNMCVLGRPFGIRQLTRIGFNVALARDLTDAMYDPREYPYVSHTRGTELVVEHIEQYWCPSILGEDLIQVIEGSNNPDPKQSSASTQGN